MATPAPESAAAAPLVHAGPRLLALLNVVATGMLFGVLQWSVFFTLQSYLASTAIVYLLGTTVWLAGSLVGLLVPGRRWEWVWIAAMLAAYYALRRLAMSHPYDLGCLPLLLVLVLVIGAYAGRFFRYRAGVFRSARWLLCLENTSFVVGLLGCFVALYFAGEPALTVGPAALALAALATHRRSSAPAAELAAARA